MNPRTKQGRDELRTVIAAATKGPWYPDDAISGDGHVVMSEDTGMRVAHLPETKNVFNAEVDAIFIARARTALPEALAALEDAEAVIEAARRWHKAEHSSQEESDALCALFDAVEAYDAKKAGR